MPDSIEHTLPSPSFRPPRLIMALLRSWFRGLRGEALIGDLLEEFHLRAESEGIPSARSWFRQQVLSSMGARVPRRRIPFVGEVLPSPAGDPDHPGSYRAGPRVIFDNLLQDLRISLRSLTRRPLFAMAAVLTLALGIGASALMFSVYQAVVLDPLPYPDSEQIVGIYRYEERVTGLNPTPDRLGGLYAVPYALYLDWKNLNTVFEDVGGYAFTTVTITGGEQPVRVRGTRATSGVFGALGVGAARGRLLVPEDDEIGAAPVTVLSNRLWQSQFGGNPEVIGRELALSGVIHTVVGVMPEDFYFPTGSEDLWLSFTDGQKGATFRPAGYMQAVARIRPGISLGAAQAEMDGVARQLGEQYPAEKEHGALIFPRKALTVGGAGSGLLIFLGAVALVLLIACANITGILLVRTMERSHEIAVRAALGSGRGRLIMQSLSESVLLASIGGLLGAGIAYLGLKPFVFAIPGGLPRASEIAVDIRLLLFAAVVALLTGIAVGIIPALRAARINLADMIGRSARGFAGGRSRNRTQAVLVVAQVAIAFALLAASGVLVQSYRNISSSDPGFSPENMLVTRISLPSAYNADVVMRYNFYQELERTLLAIPGVDRIGIAVASPFMPGRAYPPISVETSEGMRDVAEHRTTANPSFFDAMGIPLLTGRGFTETDRWDTPAVAIVNRAMADRYWSEEGALGRRINTGNEENPNWVTVVGVVGNTSSIAGGEPIPEYWRPFAQQTFTGQNVHIRTSVDPAQLVQPVRAAIWNLDPDIPVAISVMEELIRTDPRALGTRFGASTMAFFAIVSGFLVIIGIYGTLAFAVTRRRREWGIRIALGARRNAVLRSILGRGVTLAAAGLVIGFGLSFAGKSVLSSALFGVSPLDPGTLVWTALILLAAAVLAALVPAGRATRVDPVEALRQE